MITTDAYLWLALLSIVAGVVTLAYAILERILGPERTDDGPYLIDRVPPGWSPEPDTGDPILGGARTPARYVGCVTCEGAEAVGRDALIRHQLADHAGGVR